MVKNFAVKAGIVRSVVLHANLKVNTCSKHITMITFIRIVTQCT